jgi:nicotinamidase-related amidase
MPLADHPSTVSYASSGFANSIGWGTSPALILIDVCRAYWTEGSPLNTLSNPSSVASLDVMKRLLVAARSSPSTPVIWTKVEYDSPDMSDAGLFYLKAKALDVWKKGDTRGYDTWMEGLVPEEGEVMITKKYASAFFGTDLGTRLRVLGVDTLVICGVSTSGCVRATALDAMQNGYRPMVSCKDGNVDGGADSDFCRLSELDAVIDHKRFTMRTCLT